MKTITMVMATALGFGLSGCALHEDMLGDLHPSGPDGTWCGIPGVKGAVYVEIQYAGDGMPSALPSTCTVSPNVDITWRGPAGDLVPFEIVFPGESPELRDQRRQLLSSEVDGRYKVRIRASGKAGTYKYAIKANGKELDPAIIIR